MCLHKLASIGLIVNANEWMIFEGVKLNGSIA